jgi:H+-transporting ATPase
MVFFMGRNHLSIEEAKKTDITDLLAKLSASQFGLSSSEAKDRLEKYGFNELPEKKVNPLVKFLGYFWGPIPWMIEAAVIMSAIIQHWPDFDARARAWV